MQKQKNSGIGFYFVMLAVVLAVFIWLYRGGFQPETGSWQDLETTVESGQIVSAVITPNKEVPTGAVKLSFNNGTTPQTWYVDDISEVKARFRWITGSPLP